MMDYLKQMI
jgi:hypothetical protein